MRRAEGITVAVSLPVLVLAAALGTLTVAPELAIDLGPGDSRYRQGFDTSWRFDGEATWRELTRRGRVRLPLTLRGPGTLELTVRQELLRPVELQVRFDDGSQHEITIPFAGSTPQTVRLELPLERVRAVVRLRCQTLDGGPCKLDVDRLAFRASRARPERSVVVSASVLVAISFLGLLLGGLTALWATVGTGVLCACLLVLARFDSFAALHLLARAPPIVVAGLVLVVLSRFVFRVQVALAVALFYGLCFKAALVFHPSFYFVDWQIHETLLELVYHRGVLDFWSRLPEYQVHYNLGVAPVGDTFRAFPYPAWFYLFAHLGNALYHDPELWLKLTAVSVSTATILPLAYLASRFSESRHAGLVASVVYLLTPAYLRSLLLLELSALAGHFFDLLALAFFARVSLRLEGAARFLVGVMAVGASLAVYTSGFVHLGLFVGSILLLAPFIAALSPREVFRLAAASLLGASLGVLTYHPDTMRALFSSVLPQGVAATVPGVVAPDAWGLLVSAEARAVTFLGHALLPIGLLGLVWGMRHVKDEARRLLFAAWALSGAIAYTLRFVLLDLFHYQKELYWIGALFAVTAAALLAHLAASSRGKRLLAAGLSLWLVVAALQAFLRLWSQFYVDYRFL